MISKRTDSNRKGRKHDIDIQMSTIQYRHDEDKEVFNNP